MALSASPSAAALPGAMWKRANLGGPQTTLETTTRATSSWGLDMYAFCIRPRSLARAGLAPRTA
eukprot:12531590-Alexandrium_andersonii.AAC.1